MAGVVELTGESEHSGDAKLFLEMNAFENRLLGSAAQSANSRSESGISAGLDAACTDPTRTWETDSAGAIYLEILARFPDFAPARRS